MNRCRSPVGTAAFDRLRMVDKAWEVRYNFLVQANQISSVSVGVGPPGENRKPGENPGRDRRCKRVSFLPEAKAGHWGNLRRRRERERSESVPTREVRRPAWEECTRAPGIGAVWCSQKERGKRPRQFVMDCRGLLFPFPAVDPECIGGIPPGKEDVFMRRGRRRGLSLLLVLVMLLGLLPGTAWAADEKAEFSVAISNCVQVGSNEEDSPLYLCNTVAPKEASKVVFSDFEGKITQQFSMIASLGNALEMNTNIAPINQNYALDLSALEGRGWTVNEDYKTYDFSHCYAYWIVDDDDNEAWFIVKAAEEQSQDESAPFSVSIGKVRSCTENGYTYTEWDGRKISVDLYTVEIPFGTPSVTLTFDQERLAYAYDANGTYVSACGTYENNGQSGLTTAQVTAGDTGVMPDFIRVQTPYTAEWVSDTLYAVQFEYSYTFTASVNGAPLTEMTYTPNAYQYHDEMNHKTVTVGVYTLQVPENTETVNFVFSDFCLAYNYKKNGEYLGGWYQDYTTGVKTASVPVDYGTEMSPADGELDYIQIQTPYVGSSSTLLYAITFEKKGAQPSEPQEPGKQEVQIDALLEGIAARYQDTYSNSKVIIDMSAYKALNPSTQFVTTPETKQNYINFVLDALNKENVDSNSYSLAILGTQSIGVDPRQLYPVNSNIPIDAVTGLNASTHSDSAWTAPFILAAYNQGKYGTETYEQALITAVLEDQHDDGSWQEYSDSIQTTSNMVMGLSFYYDNETVKAAVDKAVEYLSKQQKEDGTFDAYGSGADADTCAMVVTALAAVGINPDSDARFVKNGNSALDGLLTFALADNSGFGYQDNTSFNSYATEDGFRALIAASRVMADGKAYNIYDFSANTDLEPGRATGDGAVTPPVNPDPGNSNVTVYFTMKADTGYWVSRKAVTVKEGSTVYHVFTTALEGTGITYTGAENGYISSVTKDGKTLGEFTSGKDSGWLYKVNGTLPDTGLTSYVVKNGDEVLWYYTTDWTTDPDAGSVTLHPDPNTVVKEQADGSYQVTLPKGSTGSVLVTIPKVSKGDLLVIVHADGTQEVVKKSVIQNGTGYLMLDENATVKAVDYVSDFGDVKESAWYADAVDFTAGRGLFSGVGGGNFAPDETLNRGMVVTVLYALEEAGAQKTEGLFSDVAGDAWYAQGTAWAMKSGIVSGYGDGQFGPDDAITREQLALMLYRYAQYMKLSTGAGASLNAFGDKEAVSSWAQQAMSWAVSAGILGGTPEGNLNPGGTATRAEAAVMVSQFVTWMLKGI